MSFTDTSSDNGGTIGSRSWNFGDGSTSTSANPSHTYAAAGTYTVTETVTDSVNGKTSTATKSVTVSSPSAGGTPTAKFTWSTKGYLVTFTDMSTSSGGTIGSRTWKFGDGSTSTATNQGHTYATPGNYTVTETVTDSTSGKSSTATHSVSVTNPKGNGKGSK